MSDPFSFKKLFGSFFTGIYWVKVVAIGLGIFALIVTGYAYYKAFIKKPLPSTVQNAEHIDSPNYYLQPRAFGCARIVIPADKNGY